MKSPKDYTYNYKKITMTLDLDQEEDREILAWLEKHKTKRNTISAQLRDAVKKLIESGK
jgi:hypothetical protein